MVIFQRNFKHPLLFSLQAVLAKDDADRNPMLNEYEDLRREMTALRNEHEKAVADKRDVFLQLQKVQLQVNEWETNYTTLKEDNERLKRENAEVKKQVALGGADYSSADGEVATLNAKIASLKEANEFLQLEKSTLEEKVGILQKTISSLENTNESLLLEKDRLQQSLDSSLKREREGSTRSGHEYSVLHRSYSSSSESDTWRAKYDEVSREKISLEYQLRVAREKISELESRSRATDISFEHGSRSLASRSISVSSYNYNSKLEEDYKNLLQDKIKAISELEMKHRRELDERQASIFKLEQEVRELRGDRNRYDELKKENEFLVKEKLSLESEVRTAREKIYVVESNKVNETRLERELVAYNDKYAALEREYSALLQEKRKFEADLYIQVRKEGEEKQKHILQLEREILELRTDKARYDDVCREKEFLLKERTSIESELRVAREKAVEYESRSMMESRTEQELTILRERYAQLEKEYSEALQERRRQEADLHIQVRREVDEKQSHIYKLESEMHELRMNAGRYEEVLKEKEYLIKERFALDDELRTIKQRVVEFESRAVIEGRWESELVSLKERYAKLESDYSVSLQEKRRLEAEYHIQGRREVEEKQSQIYKLEAEMKELRMDQARYEELYKEKEFLVKEKFDLDSELRTAREKIIDLEGRLMLHSRTEKEVVIYQDKVAKLEKEYSSLMQERQRYEADLHIQVRKEVEEKQAYIYKIERELHELQLEKARYEELHKEKEFLLKERFSLENEFRVARERISELESQSMIEARTEQELGILQERYTKLEKEYSLLVQERRRVETEAYVQARKEADERQSQIYKLEVEIRELRMDRGRLEELAKEKEFLIKEKFDLDAEMRTMRERIMEFETRAMLEGRVEKELTLLKEKYAQLERDYSGLIQEKRRMETESQILVRKEVEEKQSHIYKLEVELRELRADRLRIEELTKEKEFIIKEKFDLDAEMRTMRERIMEFETRAMLEGRVEKELTLLKEKYAQLERDYSGLIQEKRRMETESQVLVRKEVEEKQSHIYRLEQQIREMGIEKGRYDDLYKEKEFLLKERYNLENELRLAREKIGEFESRSFVEARTEKELLLSQEKYVKLEKDYSLLIQEKRKIEADIEIRVRAEGEERQALIYKLESEIHALRADKDRYDELLREKEFLFKERYNLETELREAREKVLEVETRFKSDGLRAEQEFVLLKSKYAKMEDEYNFLIEEKKKMEEDIEIRVKKEFWEKQESVYKLEKEIRELKSENEYYQTSVEEKNAAISELRVNVNNLQRQVESQKKELYVAEEAYEKAELKLKEVLKSDYKPVTTYVVRRTVRSSSSISSHKDEGDEPGGAVIGATSTPNVAEHKSERTAESSSPSAAVKTMDFNKNVVREEKGKAEVRTTPPTSKEDPSSDSVFESSSYRPSQSSYMSPRSSSARPSSRYYSSKYGSYGSSSSGGSSYTGGSSYRSRQPSSRYSAPKKYY